MSIHAVKAQAWGQLLRKQMLIHRGKRLRQVVVPERWANQALGAHGWQASKCSSFRAFFRLSTERQGLYHYDHVLSSIH